MQLPALSNHSRETLSALPLDKVCSTMRRGNTQAAVSVDLIALHPCQCSTMGPLRIVCAVMLGQNKDARTLPPSLHGPTKHIVVITPRSKVELVKALVHCRRTPCPSFPLLFVLRTPIPLAPQESFPLLVD